MYRRPSSQRIRRSLHSMRRPCRTSASPARRRTPLPGLEGPAARQAGAGETSGVSRKKHDPCCNFRQFESGVAIGAHSSQGSASGLHGVSTLPHPVGMREGDTSIQIAIAIIIRFSVSEMKPSGTLLSPMPPGARLSASGANAPRPTRRNAPSFRPSSRFRRSRLFERRRADRLRFGFARRTVQADDPPRPVRPFENAGRDAVALNRFAARQNDRVGIGLGGDRDIAFAAHRNLIVPKRERLEGL